MKPMELELDNTDRSPDPDAAELATLGAGADWKLEGLFSEEFMNALSQLSTRRFISLYASDPNDTQQIDSWQNRWVILSAGKRHVFDFTESAPGSTTFAKNSGEEYPGKNSIAETSLNCTHFLRWATKSFLSSYSPTYAAELLGSHKIFLSDLHTFDAKNCIKRLVSFNQRTGFFPWKRLIALCCEQDFPGFSIDDLIDLEGISPTVTRDHWQAYYDLEIKFKPAVLRFIEMGLGRDIAHLDSMQTEDLRSLAILVLCFESGMRPTQLYKLKDDDFQNRDNSYFSITVPSAKQAKRVEKLPFDLDLSPEAGTIIQALLDRDRPDLANNQLLRRSDGALALSITFNEALNSRLGAWASRNFVGPMPEHWELKEYLRHLPRLTAYDFRQHVGHSLAMSGASADHIARILGHSSTVAARHYIAATPELAVIKQKALGENSAYMEMMGMILTGEIGEESDWRGRKVAGIVDNRLFTGIGGCAACSCDFEPVRSCYGCSDFNPFVDGNHRAVKDGLKSEAARQLSVSDAAGQTHRNPAVVQLEGVIAEVQVVIDHCVRQKDRI